MKQPKNEIGKARKKKTSIAKTGTNIQNVYVVS